jgi:SAM-dependent methyltransferase
MAVRNLKQTVFGQGRSYRRKLLDTLMSRHAGMMKGVVVDLAGKQSNHRGSFRPPTEDVTRRIVVNLDENVAPDVVADIRDTGLESGSADCVILAETLQHVPGPERCVAEANRLLKPGGIFIGSIPFLYPIHRDPQDLIRLGPDGLKALLSDFDDVKIYSMGKFFGVLGLMLERKISTVETGTLLGILGVSKMLKAALLVTSKILTTFDRNPISLNDDKALFTTGYFFTGIKR